MLKWDANIQREKYENTYLIVIKSMYWAKLVICLEMKQVKS